jgi:hypothetical protein
MQLDLIHGRNDAGGVDELGQHGLGEVRHPDRADEPTIARVDHAPPRVDVPADARVRPVDQLQVEVVEPEHAEGALDAVDRLLATVVAPRDLRCHEQIGAVDAAATHRFADLALVLVVDRRVEQAIAALDRLDDGGDAVLAPQVVGSEAQLGKCCSVVQGESRDRGHGSILASATARRAGGRR